MEDEHQRGLHIVKKNASRTASTAHKGCNGLTPPFRTHGVPEPHQASRRGETVPGQACSRVPCSPLFPRPLRSAHPVGAVTGTYHTNGGSARAVDPRMSTPDVVPAPGTGPGRPACDPALTGTPTLGPTASDKRCHPAPTPVEATAGAESQSARRGECGTGRSRTSPESMPEPRAPQGRPAPAHPDPVHPPHPLLDRLYGSVRRTPG